jgi:hypothetical protein
MSKGPGRIERAIQAAFTRHPERSFSTDELGPIACPGLDRLEKKHRVAVARAAGNVMNRMPWGAYRAGGTGGRLFYCNFANPRSAGLGLERSRRPDIPLPDLEQRFDDPADRCWEETQPGGVFDLHCQIDRARRSGDAADELARLQEALKKRVRSVRW